MECCYLFKYLVHDVKVKMEIKLCTYPGLFVECLYGFVMREEKKETKRKNCCYTILVD